MADLSNFIKQNHSRLLRSTSILFAIARFASRNDIICRVAAALRDWYYVILLQLFGYFKPFFPAIRASITIIGKDRLPFLASERGGQCRFAGIVPLFVGATLFRVTCYPSVSPLVFAVTAPTSQSINAPTVYCKKLWRSRLVFFAFSALALAVRGLGAQRFRRISLAFGSARFTVISFPLWARSVIVEIVKGFHFMTHIAASWGRIAHAALRLLSQRASGRYSVAASIFVCENCIANRRVTL